MDEMDNTWGDIDGDVDWGDDEDEDVFNIALSQVEEKQRMEEMKLEERKMEQKNEEGRMLQQFRNRDKSGANGQSLSPSTAAQVFSSRREILENERDQRAGPSSSSSMEASTSLVNYLRKQFAEEKQKNIELTDRLFAAIGESGNLRRQVESLKNNQQEDVVCRLRRDREEKNKHEEERRRLEARNRALETELRSVKNQNAALQTKNAIRNAANRSVGGAQTQFHSKTSYAPSTGLATGSKPRSDPNLGASFASLQSLDTSLLPVSPNKPKVTVAEANVQIDLSQIEQERRDEQLFRGNPGSENVNIKSLEHVSSLEQLSVRRQIFETMRKLIELDFQTNGKSVLDKIVAKAPKEIMARYTRGVEIRTCFPDLVENMFLYGIQTKRKNESEMKKYPKLGSSLNPPILHMDSMNANLESKFVYSSAWLALKEIKEQLQKLLIGLKGDLRFRLYELPNLHSLWKLLAWAKHLWKFVTFEEEFDDIVNEHGRDVWVEELKEWTGLILKIDWRDYYATETEQLVRGYSLSILEIIVTAGYFDSSQRRYEILYCILKDTLNRDHLRSEEFLRRCLNIVTWSISDNRNILNYLCIGNNKVNCLARVLGDNVQKCFMKLSSPYKATTLFLHYCHLLESLMVKRPPRHFSEIASPPTDKDDLMDDDSEDEVETEENADDSVAVDEDQMEVDMMSTQFACSEKYKLEDGSSQRARKFNRVKAATCWINPVEWEVPIDDSRSPEAYPCQCRKVLLGSTFAMLYRVVRWWKEAIVKRDEEIEERQGRELLELQKMKEERDESMTGEFSKKEIIANLSKKVESLRQFIIKFANGEIEEDKKDKEGSSKDEDDDIVLEQTWDEILGKWDPPEDLSPMNAGYADKLFPTTIFDLAVRNGIMLMNFCHFHSNNIALAAGSEAFNCFTLLISEIKGLENQPCFTAAEKRLLMEIIKSGEDDSERISGLSMFTEFSGSSDDDDDDEANTSFEFLPESDDESASYTNFPDMPKKPFSESEFERACELMEKEMNKHSLKG